MNLDHNVKQWLAYVAFVVLPPWCRCFVAMSVLLKPSFATYDLRAFRHARACDHCAGDLRHSLIWGRAIPSASAHTHGDDDARCIRRMRSNRSRHFMLTNTSIIFRFSGSHSRNKPRSHHSVARGATLFCAIFAY